MAAIENILAWAKQEQTRLAQRLEQLQSGRLHVVEKHAQPPGWLEVDATAQSIELCQLYLSELSAIIALNPEVVPTEPAAPPLTPRFIPPQPPATAQTPPPPSPARNLLHGLLHTGAAQHADWVLGWGVVKGQPPRWEFAGIYETHAEASEAAAAAGEGYYARWGSYNQGSQEFTSGPQFDRADTL
ncbi:MAG TPA: hypothetical protein VG651_16405 [Stellaceae bacterium]|nr:hypothetical protein [Stellaceae bacterium]